MKNFLTVLVATLAIGACGGGISDSKKLADLTNSEAKELCEESIGKRTITCDGTTITLETTQEDCDDAGMGSDEVPASCAATVGDFRACDDAIKTAPDADLCSGAVFESGPCAKIAACDD